MKITHEQLTGLYNHYSDLYGTVSNIETMENGVKISLANREKVPEQADNFEGITVTFDHLPIGRVF